MKVANVKPFVTRLSVPTLTDLAQRNYANSQVSSFHQQNALIYRSRKFLFNTFYELESKMQNTRARGRKSIDSIMRKQRSSWQHTANAISSMS